MNEKQALPTLMSVSELREYLHINNQKAYELVRQRSFPSFKIGSRYYINKEKIPEWIEKCSLMKQ